jgi:cell division cycle protein 37
MMIGQLLGDVFREGCWIMEGAQVTNGKVMKDGKAVDEKSGEPSWSTGSIPENKKEGLKVVLEERLGWHLKELDRRDKEVKVEIETEEAENKKKITSEDMTEGWNTSSVTKAQPSVIDDKPKIAKSKPGQTKEQTIEVLNPGASVRYRHRFVLSATDKQSSAQPKEEEEEEDELPEFGPLTPAARAFVQIPIGDFEKSYAAIQKDSSVLSEVSHDSLLAEAFDAERRGDQALAKRCVHQSLLVNYCRQLGRDGVGLFFQKYVLLPIHVVTLKEKGS